ncbi:MAG: hypothetical protein NC398_06940 [Acetatifactor muris]|nr:hypothetical protein [Acetatifactor muris]MCM1525672.1 hypothetical protein [Bacteroides sp.]
MAKSKLMENFLTKEGESVEEARARLAVEQKEREEKSAAEMQSRKAGMK